MSSRIIAESIRCAAIAEAPLRFPMLPGVGSAVALVGGASRWA
jgi:hypothetical protein